MFEYNLFKKLPGWMQSKVLRQQGSFLSKREYKGWEIHLYSLEHQLVEVWQKDGLEVITNFKPTAPALQVLEPYVGSIEVQDF
ncbi:hypothetical protein [Rufibacter quisquiliarum]|uniref:Uncharacterized protein n=1 Tax=Rufibacter quisquiliarum TaxID=1549639 RepID=A0A839GUN8_9BACT|nr:hypothetical protein [Rufibacter quisquiliarum]MBA9079195.1 hypothetical protein [Rufibacter quisquiliarum]